MVIIASDLSYLSGRQVKMARGMVSEQEMDGVRILRAWTYPSLHRSFPWRVVSFLSFMLTSTWAGLRSGPIDVVIGTSPPIFQALSAWIVAFLRRRPFVLEIRDLWPDFAVGMGVLRNPVLIWLSLGLERFLYRRACRVIVNSPAYRDLIDEKGVDKGRIELIPNGVDPAMFDPAERGEAVRDELGLGDAVVVLYAGALGMANDLSMVLLAAARLTGEVSIRFVLVGDGKERGYLEREASRMGLGNVVFTGARPKSEMRGFLGAADICVATLQPIPMFATTYPNKVFDYMAAGRPTVLGIDGVIREVVEASGGGVFVSPGDDEAFAAAILGLARDPLARHRMGNAARVHVERNFNRMDQALRFREVLVDVVGP